MPTALALGCSSNTTKPYKRKQGAIFFFKQRVFNVAPSPPPTRTTSSPCCPSDTPCHLLHSLLYHHHTQNPQPVSAIATCITHLTALLSTLPQRDAEALNLQATPTDIGQALHCHVSTAAVLSALFYHVAQMVSESCGVDAWVRRFGGARGPKTFAGLVQFEL